MGRRHLVALSAVLASFLSALLDPEVQEKLLREYTAKAVKEGLLTVEEAKFVRKVAECAMKVARKYGDYYRAALACAGEEV